MSSRQIRQGAFAQHLFALPPLHNGSVFLDPENRPGGAALDRRLGLVVLAVVDHRQVVGHFDHARRVRGAASAGGAGHFAVFQNFIARFQVFAGHPQAVAGGMEGEQPFGADFHAVSAGGAFFFIHHRQGELVHVDGVEVADHFAVGQS